MKKLTSFLLLFIILILLLPLAGNRVAEKSLKNKIEVLNSYGVELANSSSSSNYLITKKHYEFLIKDSAKFIEYLNQFSDNKIPSNINSVIEGNSVGVDLKYSNFLFSDSISADFYPLSLPTVMSQTIKKEEPKFYEYITKLFKDKAFLYHLNYSVASGDFDGFIKDMELDYLFSDNSKVKLSLKGSTFNGSGPLMAPDNVSSNIGFINLEVKKSTEELAFELNNLKAISTFKSQSTYATDINIQSLTVDTKNADSSQINANGIYLKLSSNTELKKAEFYAKSSLKKLAMKSAKKSLSLSDLNYEVTLKDVDKDAFEELRVLISKAKVNSSPELQMKVQDSILNLFSKGLDLNIVDLSLAKILVDDTKTIDGFSLDFMLNLKEDADLVKNINMNPAIFMQNITLNSTLKLSKPFFKFLNNEAPLTALAAGFAKEDADNVIFVLKLQDSNATINGMGI